MSECCATGKGSFSREAARLAGVGLPGLAVGNVVGASNGVLSVDVELGAVLSVGVHVEAVESSATRSYGKKLYLLK